MAHPTSIRGICIGIAIAVATASCGGEEPMVEYQTHELTAAVEQWRKLVEKHLKYQHVTWGLNIIKCESGGNPSAYNKSSGASGLFQHLKKYWPARAAAAGFAGASPFNAEANIAASAYLLYTSGGGPKHWSCKYSPYEDFSYQPKYYKNGSPVGPPPPPPPPCPTQPAAGGVIDESSTCFTQYGPSQYWRVVTGQGHKSGLRWTNACQQSTPSNWARWQIKLAAAGKYTVQYYAVAAYAKFKNTRYVIRHAGKDRTLIVDQSVGGTGWRTLGTFDFAAGGGQHVSIHDDTSSPVAKDQHITADAIKLIPAASPPPPKQDSGTKPPAKQDSGTKLPAKQDSGVITPTAPADDGGLHPAEADGGVYAPGPNGHAPGPNEPGAPSSQGGGVLGGGCSAMGGAPLPNSLSLLLALGLLPVLRRRRS